MALPSRDHADRDRDCRGVAAERLEHDRAGLNVPNPPDLVPDQEPVLLVGDEQGRTESRPLHPEEGLLQQGPVAAEG